MTSAPHVPRTTIAELDAWLRAKEGEHVEFKEAKTQFSFDELVRYCCALANEGGGRVLLGVTNARPRRVVGSAAFAQPEDTRRGLIRKLALRVDFEEIAHTQGRVLVFTISSRPVGVPVKADGIYWAREADSLVPMPETRLRAIFEESQPDFSAQLSPAVGMKHLDPVAIERFRELWVRTSRNRRLDGLSHAQLIRDAGLAVEGAITNAALILLGTRAAVARHLAQAEVVFEYRTTTAAGKAQQREELRQGFFAFDDEVWRLVARRNDAQHYLDGLVMMDVPTFDEGSVREALLNAIGHRDYRLPGSVFVRQYPRSIVFESPGGFPFGVTVGNILDTQSARNRLIVETFGRCGLVERAGQGMNIMFEESVRLGKRPPDFTGSDAARVVLTLSGEVWDPRFVRFVERVRRERRAPLDAHDFQVLDLVHRELPLPAGLEARRIELFRSGLLDRVGRGAGVRYLLSRRIYGPAERRTTVATHERTARTDAAKALVMDELVRAGDEGLALAELERALPAFSRFQLKRLVQALGREGRATVHGERRGARWRAAEAG